MATDSLDASAVTYLTGLWQSHLNRSEIGELDSFFDMGGSSMQVIEMLMVVAERYGRDIDYVEFFKEPCIRRLSELLAG